MYPLFLLNPEEGSLQSTAIQLPEEDSESQNSCVILESETFSHEASKSVFFFFPYKTNGIFKNRHVNPSG